MIYLIALYLLLSFPLNYCFLLSPRDESPTELGVLFILSPLTLPIEIFERFLGYNKLGGAVNRLGNWIKK